MPADVGIYPACSPNRHAILFLRPCNALAVPAGGESPAAAMQAELKRGFAAYSSLEELPLYYLAYRITDVKRFNLNAAWGAIETRQEGRNRVLDLDIRVGSPDLDNTHRDAGADAGGVPVTIEDDAAVLRADLWVETERRYRDAVEKFIKVAADRAVKVEEEDPSPDFSPAPKVELREEPRRQEVDEEGWARALKRVSSVFRRFPDVLDSRVQMSVDERTVYFADSEGSFVEQFLPLSQVMIWAAASFAP